ncbi:MAG: hypothetical protein JNL81_14020 [Hyphomonadaceae bacterium]|nr:hypothetical protein [Hyphomonadaceae bacterium]
MLGLCGGAFDPSAAPAGARHVAGWNTGEIVAAFVHGAFNETGAGPFHHRAAPALSDPFGVLAFHRRRLAFGGQMRVLNAALAQAHAIGQAWSARWRAGWSRLCLSALLERRHGRTAKHHKREGGC